MRGQGDFLYPFLLSVGTKDFKSSSFFFKLPNDVSLNHVMPNNYPRDGIFYTS